MRLLRSVRRTAKAASNVVCPAEAASARIPQVPFLGPLTLMVRCYRSRREAASGASRRACIYCTRMHTVRDANVCLSCEHSHRRRLFGREASVFRGEGTPALSSPVSAPVRWRTHLHVLDRPQDRGHGRSGIRPRPRRACRRRRSPACRSGTDRRVPLRLPKGRLHTQS
jgi:hypothetical protein